jgi:hypothetical protein
MKLEGVSSQEAPCPFGVIHVGSRGRRPYACAPIQIARAGTLAPKCSCLEGDLETLMTRGVEIKAEVEEVPWGRFVTFDDTDGNGSVLQTSSASSTPSDRWGEPDGLAQWDKFGVQPGLQRQQAADGHLVDVRVLEGLLEVWDGTDLLKNVLRTTSGEVRKKRAEPHRNDKPMR